MSYRGWHEPDSHWLEDFICGFLGGTMGFFNFPGWLFVYFGWLDIKATLLICASVGIVFAAWLAYEARKEKNNIRDLL